MQTKSFKCFTFEQSVSFILFLNKNYFILVKNNSLKEIELLLDSIILLFFSTDGILFATSS